MADRTVLDEIAGERRRAALEVDLEYAKSRLSDAQAEHDAIVAEIERLDRADRAAKEATDAP